MKKILAAFLMMVAVLTVTTTPAFAAESDCSPGQMCLWTSYNATGTRFQAAPGLDQCINLSGSVDNNAEWGYNRTAHGIWTYNGYNGTGASGFWAAGGHGPTNTANFNNISSLCRLV